MYTLPYHTLAPHQMRVVEEKADLDGRLHRLSSFFTTDIFQKLGMPEQGRLHRQAAAMHAYSAVLGERIDAFFNEGR